MSLLFGRPQARANLEAYGALVRDRVAATGTVSVTQETALRHSGVWAGLRLRADLVSSMPVDVFRVVDGIQIGLTTPPVLVNPSPELAAIPGAPTIGPWLWATQFDLDRYGNAFGVITARDGGGRPAQIDLVSAGDVVVRGKGAQVTEYRVGRERFADDEAPGRRLADVWHERQYQVAGSPIGLCPIGFAAWTIGGYLSAAKFAVDYFAKGGMPLGHLRNTQKASPGRAMLAEAKALYKAATQDGDLFATGSEWEFTPAAAPEAASAFLEAQRASVVDVARYLNVPATVIEGAVSGSSVTYANLSQDQQRLLVINLGPTLKRREDALSGLLARPRFVKLNADAVLRMDPQTRAQVMGEAIRSWRMTPSEARALDNRPPLTPEQVAELQLVNGRAPSSPTPTGAA